MLGSSNANIVQAYSWSCLTPPHLEPKRYPLHMSPGKNVDTCHRTRSSTLPLTKSLKDNLHHGTSQNGDIGRNPPSGHTRDKTNQIHNQSHSAKYKTNPFRKSQYRNRPPSCLRRPSKDWLNHLHLVRQITATCSPNTEMPSQPIAFLPLCGAI